MTNDFFSKQVGRARGRWAIAGPKPETILAAPRNRNATAPSLALHEDQHVTAHDAGPAIARPIAEPVAEPAEHVAGPELAPQEAPPALAPAPPRETDEHPPSRTRRSESEPAPAIDGPPLHITIARVEIHAPPSKPDSRGKIARTPSMSLSDYLNRRR